jgi:hypothetical protein
MGPFDRDLTRPQPDIYYGSRPCQVDIHVCEVIGKYIIPSTSTTNPVAPNFYLECEPAKGNTDVKWRKIMHAGAMGARAMDRLRNYGNDVLIYDGHACPDHHRLLPSRRRHPTTIRHTHTHTHTHGPQSQAAPGTEPDYHLTRFRSFFMTESAASFRAGATAYRDARDRGPKRERDDAIVKGQPMSLPDVLPDTDIGQPVGAGPGLWSGIRTREEASLPLAQPRLIRTQKSSVDEKSLPRQISSTKNTRERNASVGSRGKSGR